MTPEPWFSATKAITYIIIMSGITDEAAVETHDLIARAEAEEKKVRFLALFIDAANLYSCTLIRPTRRARLPRLAATPQKRTRRASRPWIRSRRRCTLISSGGLSFTDANRVMTWPQTVCNWSMLFHVEACVFPDGARRRAATKPTVASSGHMNKCANLFGLC